MASSGKQTSILLYGLGAIGGFYAFILGRNSDVSLSVVARSNYEAVKQNGLKIQSENHGEHLIRPSGVFKSPAEAGRTFDYVVCAHKALNQDSVPPQLEPVVGKDTTLVIIQNGVGNEVPFRKHFPDCTIISCVTWVGATQTKPGVIKHTKSEAAEFGLFSNSRLDSKLEQSRLDEFTTLLRNGGTKFTVEENIQVKRWEKVVWNAAWNPLTTLTMIDTQTWLKSSPEAMPMTRQLMQEVIDVAKRCDVPLSYDLIDTLIDKILAMPGIGSSMQTDAKEGGRLKLMLSWGHQ
ncbi:hypothetical protein H2203_001122 [Taxawa tesnikishii (nom. ined.)]|nr:hypothetical protein H2203_001122 [Dothideales sp. JES 119]